MKARLITYPDRKVWNNFVASTSESPILQSFEWGEIKSHFGWQPIRIALEEGNKIVAAVSVLKREIPYLRHCLFYAPRGPVVDFSNRELLEALLDAVEKEADKHHAIYLKIDPDVSEKEASILQTLHVLGFEKAPKQVQPRATMYLDLVPSLDEILMRFEEKTRYNVRLAEKKGVTIKEDSSAGGLDIFHGLYRPTAERDRVLIHPLSYFQKIREYLLEKGMGKNFIAYHAGKPIGAVIVFCFGSKIWYMYGAS